MIPNHALESYADTLRADPDRWLGLLVAYSVEETTVRHVDLVNYLDRHGLGEFAPRRPADVDVFRRASTGAQRKRQPTADPDVYVNILVRDVSSDDDQVLRRLVVETVDGKGRRLDYTPVYDLIFTKATSYLDIKAIGRTAFSAADEVQAEIARSFKTLLGTVDGAAVRSLINRVLDDSQATSLRKGGGVYFVAPEKAKVVEGLEQLATLIAGTTVHTVPLPNDDKQRAQVQAAFEDEAKEEMERAQAEIAKLLASGEKISGEKLAAVARRYRVLKEKAEAYAATLRVNLTQTTAGLTVLDLQVAQLAGVVTGVTRPADKAVA